MGLGWIIQLMLFVGRWMISPAPDTEVAFALGWGTGLSYPVQTPFFPYKGFFCWFGFSCGITPLKGRWGDFVATFSDFQKSRHGRVVFR